MRLEPVPTVATALAVAGLAAQALSWAPLAAVVAVAALWLASLLGQHPRRALRWGLAVVMTSLAATLAVLLVVPPRGGGTLALLLVLVAVAGIAMPLLYAFGMGRDGGEP